MGSDVTIDFANTDTAAVNLLTIRDLPDFAASVTDLVTGDTIDLAGVQADKAVYDQSTGMLALEQRVQGAAPTVLGQVHIQPPVPGAYANRTFELSSDGAGGTRIVLGAPQPGVLTLAQMSQATYLNTSNTQPVGNFVLRPDYTAGADDKAFKAEAFQDGNQIVLAIRGTETQKGLAILAKNALADESFRTGTVTADLSSFVSQAANLLATIRSDNPYAEITITGHSLGGAIAQLLGDASGYPTVVFNAPGAGALESQLSAELAPARSAGFDASGINQAYRLYGDQISHVGTPIGETVTILTRGSPSDQPVPPSPALIGYDHDIGTVINWLRVDAGTSAGFPDDALPGWSAATGAAVPLGAWLVGQYVTLDVTTAFVAGDASSLQTVDPAGGLQFQLIRDAGAPQMVAFQLPLLADVSGYSVQLEHGSSWSDPTTVLPGAIVSETLGFDGLRFTALDAAGQPLVLGNSFFFGLGFNSVGTFDGKVSAVAEITGNTFTWAGGNGLLSEPADWIDQTDTVAGPPTSVDDAQFLAAGGTLQGSGSYHAALFDGSGPWVMTGSLSASSQVELGASPSTLAQLNVLAGGAISTGGTVSIGTAGSSSGRLILNDGSLIAAGGITVGSNGSGTVTLGQAGLLLGSTVTVGSAAGSTGSVSIAAGGTVASSGPHVAGHSSILLGGDTGSAGSVVVSGAGALLDSGGDRIAIGSSGQGQLTVTQGGTVLAGTQFASNSAAYLGYAAGASGNLVVSGAGSSFRANGQLSVGVSGVGHLSVQNQATVTTGGNTAVDASQGLDIAGASGGTGDATVTGSNALLANSGRFIVGDGGIGSLSVQNHATVTTNPGTAVSFGAVIANQSGSDGSSVSVIGSGSQWQVGGTLVVGYAANGGLSVASGGTMSAGALDIGVLNSGGTVGSGVVSLSGSGSALNVTGSATIGDAGVGELSILTGAGASIGGDLNVGNIAGGSGNVDIESPAGTVSIGGNLNIGLAGVGVLTIGQNSELTVKGGLNTGPNATINQYGAIDPQRLDNNGTFNVNSSSDIIYSQYVVNSGTFNIGTGGSNIAYVLETPTITNDGTTSGAFNIGKNHASLTLDSHIFSGQTINFADATGTLVIGHDTLQNFDVTSTDTNQPNPNYLKELIQGFTATINYQVGDQIVVDTTQAATFDYTADNTDVFVVENGATVGALNFVTTAQAAAAFTSGDLVASFFCFAAGTRIRTERGEVAVEDLRQSDRVWSVLGRCFQPVQWIGFRQANCRAHPRPWRVWPVVVSAGSFGPGLPARDLWLSPDHALFMNGVLIPVKLLVNDTTIRQVAVETVMYYHVELPAHDVLLAEGLAAESYLDVGDRSSFANGGGPVALHPDFVAQRWELCWEAESCAPLYVTGPEMEAARALLSRQAA